MTSPTNPPVDPSQDSSQNPPPKPPAKRPPGLPANRPPKAAATSEGGGAKKAAAAPVRRTRAIKPPAKLAPRAGDEVLTIEQLEELSLFESMDRPPDFSEFPAYAVLRRYHPDDDEPICWQDDPGWTAFYILTAEDLWELRMSQLRQARAATPRDDVRVASLEKAVSELSRRIQPRSLLEARVQSLETELQAKDGPSASRVERLQNQIVDLASLLAADARANELARLIENEQSRPEPRSGWIETLQNLRVSLPPGRSGSMAIDSETTRAATGPANGADDPGDPAAEVIVEPESPKRKKKRARADRSTSGKGALSTPKLMEGELFGEMSCRSRAPRSATIRALREIYVLEMLRNIYDRLESDRNLKEKLKEKYKKRVVDRHLRGHQLFRSFSENDAPSPIRDGVRTLSPTDYRDLRERIVREAELESKDPGDIIIDEFERADALYIVCSGFVQVSKHVSFLLCPTEIQGVESWRKLAEALRNVADDDPYRQWKQAVKATLAGNEIKAALDLAQDGTDLADAHRLEIVHAINSLISDRKFGEKVKLVDEEPKAAPAGGAVVVVADASVSGTLTGTQRDRYRNRLLLQKLYPDVIPPTSFRGIPHVLGYRSQGEFIGEKGLLNKDGLRTATCLAYDHPKSKSGKVELLKIGKSIFEELLKNAGFDEAVRNADATRPDAAADGGGIDFAVRSERFEELGLVQGRELMLIDMDRCTRCDECVQACTRTHASPRAGLSRLFLSGPRIGQFLLPTTCRQCRDPVCLIGCPVGAIHKGELGQIVIEDWCIGCTRCAMNCPYDAIQMRPIGMLPRAEFGWRYRLSPAGDAGADWTAASYDDSGWSIGKPPFRYDLEFRNSLRTSAGGRSATSAAEKRPAAPAGVCFRFALTFPDSEIADAEQFLLQIESNSETIEAWINGDPVALEKSPGRPFGDPGRGTIWHRQALLHVEKPAAARKTGAAHPLVRSGRNVVAVRVSPTSQSDQVLFDAGLFHYRTPAVKSADTAADVDVIEELLIQQAVVCDLCATSKTQTPACVSACPHDAAWRGHPRDEDSPLRRILSYS